MNPRMVVIHHLTQSQAQYERQFLLVLLWKQNSLNSNYCLNRLENLCDLVSQ